MMRRSEGNSGAVLDIVTLVLNVNKLAPLGRGQMIACVVSGLLFLSAWPAAASERGQGPAGRRANFA